MSSILIYHHLGLGDHFICHGIVREYCKKYDRVGLFCKRNNYTSVSFMYRDIPNLTIIEADDVAAKKNIFWNHFKFGKNKYQKVIYIGFQNLNRTSNEQLEQQFYKIAGIDFNKKWDSFYVERDYNHEEILETKISLPQPYAFVHDDASRDMKINESHVGKNVVIFRPEKSLTTNVFDYCGIIENAKEIHVIDSSFMFMIDCLNYTNNDQKLFVHRYARKNAEWLLPILKKDWIILK